MADETVFDALYEELGLRAECALDDFKRAYRRRASQLHPDHSGVAADMSRLQRLNGLYDAALDFHRTYGRLPGGRPAPQIHRITAIESSDPPPVPSGRDDRPVRRKWYLPVGAALALLLYWLGLQRGNAPSLDPAGPGDEVAPGLFQPHTLQLGLGMDQKLARDILGEPDNESATRWDYGPSWVELQCGKVIGWYSSPQRPLRVDQDSAHAAPTQAPGC